MAEHPPPSAPWFTPLSDNFSPSPMDGVAELVLESGQLLARRPRLSTRYSCPSRLDKLDAQCDEEEEEEEGDRRACVKKRNSDMLIDSHVVPEYKETENSLNNDIVPKVPDDHQVQNRNEFGVGWGPFGRILQQQNQHQHQHQHQHQNHPDQNEPRLHNFTHFLRPSRLLRPDGRQSTNSCSTSSTNGPNSSTRLDRLTQSASGKTPPVESTLVESGSRSVKALGNQLGLLATEAVSDDRAKKIVAAKDENREQPGANTSICSLAASNNLGRHQVSSNGEKGRKRKRRSAEIHSQSEKKRRAKINKKLSMLQDLIPNANKVDKASLLDDAIEYLKTLQLQLQMMAMGRGLMMHPMMLPSMQPPPMAQGMGLGMGMNMPMGLGCIPNPFSSASPALGLPGQILPVPMPQMQSFGHLPTGVLSSSSNPVIPMPGVELLGSAPAMMSSRDAFQNINHESMNIDHKKAG